LQPAELRIFADALCDPSAPLPAGLRAPQGAALPDRFAVYRNNVHVGLIDVLTDRFPVARQLVGEEFFHAMAREYVRDNKPDSPVLQTYGSGFADFISTFAPAAQLAYLPDVARLEYCWSEAWAAAEAPSLTLGELSKYSAEMLLQARFKTHPAARLLQSNAPIASLWQAHQSAEPDLSAIIWQPEDVLITRPEAQINLHSLAAGVAAFANALANGSTFQEAAAQATPAQDHGATLGQLILDGFFTEVHFK
jgi:hypothetical protein